MAPLQSPNAPTRTSTRTPKPSARKRAQSTPIPTGSVVILSDADQDILDTAEDAEEADAKEAEEEEAEEEEAEEEEAEEEEAEEAEEEEAEEAEEETLKFMSIWRASCGKEQLLGTRSRVLDPSLISLMAVHK
ncbi:hypothetical protein VE00_10160 [Pseudogymnoascus sp. WSF 3629]|nr:hypothetical protein VE00_10160 [Pseudogymnoascus sp. WSF 3629]